MENQASSQSTRPALIWGIVLTLLLTGFIGLAALSKDSGPENSTGSYSEAELPEVKDGKQAAVITVNNTSYSPSTTVLRKGVPAEITFLGQGGGCSTAIVSRDFWDGVIFVEKGDKKVVSFTPNESGRFKYTCTMGMYTGWIDVV